MEIPTFNQTNDNTIEFDVTDDCLEALVVITKNRLSLEVTKESLSWFSNSISSIDELKKSVADVYMNEVFIDVVKNAIDELEKND